MRPLRSIADTFQPSAALLCLGVCLLNVSFFLVGCSHGSPASTTQPAVPPTIPTTPPSVAPSITTQPAAQSVYVGAAATFSVAATGTAPISYQWLRGSSAIAGATASTYTLATTSASDSGSLFSVQVSNNTGSVTSSTAELTVTAPPSVAPSITTQPAAQSVYISAAATFSVAATGTAPISYQWLRGSLAITGATASTYTLAVTSASDSGSLFSVQVSNSVGSVTSSTAELTVNPNPVSIVTEPANSTQFAGETATFSVTATGTSPIYQWRKDAATISGATSATYTTPVLVATDDNSIYDVLVSNSASTVSSNVVTLRVAPFATSYTTQQGVVLSLYAWPGNKNAFLTMTTNLDGPTMRKIVTAADNTWNYYAGADGKLPSYHFTYTGPGANGPLATIANTGIGGVNLCGDGCTFIGATGMEVSNNAFSWLYNGVLSNAGYDQVIFYEFGRSFWLFSSQLQYPSPADSSCEVTGFAVLMRYRSVSAEMLTGLYGGIAANYTSQYSNSLGMIDTYAADPSLNFNNTFLTNSFTSPYGGCSDLWSSMMIRLAQTYGGEAFIQSIFKEALKRPAAVTTQDAVDNFVLAASAAADKNLTLTFGTTWKWPVSTAASQEAQSLYGNPQ